MDLKWEHKVHQIMMRAQELSPTELERFLEKTCGDDTRLRREVEKRLEGIQDRHGKFAKTLRLGRSPVMTFQKSTRLCRNLACKHHHAI